MNDWQVAKKDMADWQRGYKGKQYILSSDHHMRLNDWHYHAPQPGQPERYDIINKHTKDIAHMIMSLVPPGRQQALALTKLEEVRMWANNGIAMEQE